MSDIHDPVARFDQATSEQKDFAKMVRGYYSTLLAQGFSADDALFLTASYQGALIGAANR